MEEIEHAQTILERSELDKLKRIVKETSTKEALRVAVGFTIKNYGKV